MTKKDKKELIEDFKNHGLDDEIIEQTILGVEDFEQGRIYTTKEVIGSIYKNKKECYA